VSLFDWRPLVEMEVFHPAVVREADADPLRLWLLYDASPFSDAPMLMRKTQAFQGSRRAVCAAPVAAGASAKSRSRRWASGVRIA
jgi:hypothetical protein